MPTQPLSVGFIGLSHLHPRLYMPLFREVPDTRVVAVAESDPALLEGFTRDFPVRGYPHWHQLLQHEPLDLAMIFLPHADCPDAAVACAQHGINVVVEKPMAASAEGVRRMIAAAAQAHVLVSTPYVWRYNPVSVRMKELIKEGVTGRIVACDARCAAGRVYRYTDGHAAWMLQKARSGRGPMFNLGVHWIDLYRWFLADEVTEVMGKNVHVGRHYDIEDNSFAILTFSKGAVVALDIGYTVPQSFPGESDIYLTLRGATGMMTWSPSTEGLKESLYVYSDTGEYSQSSHQHLDFDIPQHPGYAGFEGYRFLVELVESIRSRKPPAITANDGLKALEVVEAIYQSAESGRSVSLEQ